MDAAALLEVLEETASAVRAALDRLDDWGPAGTRPGQYRADLVADAAALAVLRGSGLAVLSEESGVTGDAPLLAVLDPLDGSTNAARGIERYATSICVLDGEGPLVALVANQATGARYRAIRGGGAERDGRPLRVGASPALPDAVIGLSGYPPAHLGWRQYRALGAAALDLCAVADGTLDAYLDCGLGSHGAWDYLGGILICLEAGAAVGEVSGRDLVVRVHAERRSPAAAASPKLRDDLIAALQTARRASSTR